MRAHEFIREAKSGKLKRDAAKALPATYVMPELPNQDPYLQYRFGVAIAGAKSAAHRATETAQQPMDATSVWGENQIVVSYGEDAGPMIDAALRTMGKRGKNMISTPRSEEDKRVDNVVSPVRGFSGYGKKRSGAK